jgi:integrase
MSKGVSQKELRSFPTSNGTESWHGIQLGGLTPKDSTVARKSLKPWFRADRNAWFVCLQGKQINLGADKTEAERRFHEIMAAGQPSVHPQTSPLVCSIIDRFLEWTQSHRAGETYVWYQKHLQAFLNSLAGAARLAVDQLKPFHVHQWIDKKTTWGPSYRRGAIIAVQRVFTWAEQLGYIEQNPIRHIEKPTPDRREKTIPSEHYRTMLDGARKQTTRDLLTFSWEIGPRPQETRIIEARHFNAAAGRIEIPPAEAKGRKRWRIIYLTEKALEIVKRLVAKHATGPIFRNHKGRPWTADATSGLFNRMKKKLHARYSLYTFRHSFCQRMLELGMDHLTVAGLMGHANGQMVATTYSHMAKAKEYLQEQLKKMSA